MTGRCDGDELVGEEWTGDEGDRGMIPAAPTDHEVRMVGDEPVVESLSIVHAEPDIDARMQLAERTEQTGST